MGERSEPVAAKKNKKKQHEIRKNIRLVLGYRKIRRNGNYFYILSIKYSEK